jgi:hypothetical protein
MTDQDRPATNPERETSLQVGFYASILTSVVTLITFALALTAIPISGTNCPGDCISYPYLDTVAQFPRDYRWMLPAIVLLLIYVILVISIHGYAPDRKRVFGQIGLAFAIMSAVILVSTYYSQAAIVPVSLMFGETEGIALLTQYNPHGLFIALEELGYLLMSLSFLFVALVFGNQSRLEAAVKWVFLVGFGLSMAALIVIALIYGLDRQDRFEVAIISIDWLVLLFNGVLLSLVFRSVRQGDSD